ncbi:MAG: AmpG family muropeptide MFS transporter [Rhodospirillales bacterium]|nr:AmpG family muropeptide MFS transporter [Rhodospirillales bacterium]
MSQAKSWIETSKVYFDRRVLAVLFLGFSSGLPLLLVFSTLSLWLKDEGISKTVIGIFALVRTPYTFKFLWAPLIDRLPFPFLAARLGRRRAWVVATQLALMAAILGLASTSPGLDSAMTALLALVVAFASASQDIVIDAYRIEILSEEQQGAGAAMVVNGYRVGMLMAGAGAISLADVLSWHAVYSIMAAMVVVGLVTILLSPEPQEPAGGMPDGDQAGGRWGWLQGAVVAPFSDFMRRDGWVFILLFIMLYKLGDAYLGVMANPFYVEMGFSKNEIAAVSKVFGLGATITGGLIGGVIVYRYGIRASLLIAGVLMAASNLVFAAQAMVGHSVPMLMVTIAAENLTGGMGTTAFVAYLSSLCHMAYTATQYALLSSFMAFARDVLSASSGWLADHVSWVTFFVVTTFAALPGLILLVWMMRRFPPEPDG